MADSNSIHSFASNILCKDVQAYFNRSPSNTMVRKILNLLSTVNMGKLRRKRKCSDVWRRTLWEILFHITYWGMIKANKLSLQSLRSKQSRYLIPDIQQRQWEHLEEWATCVTLQSDWCFVISVPSLKKMTSSPCVVYSNPCLETR